MPRYDSVVNANTTSNGARWSRSPRHLGIQLRTWTRLSARAAWRAGVNFINNDDLTFASSIAYYALLSLFPLFLLAFSVLGNVAADEADRAALLSFVLQYFPGQSALVTDQLDALRRASAGLGVAGGALIAWTALGVFRAITSAVNHAWAAPEPGGFLRHHLVSFVMLLATGLLLLVALALYALTRVVEASWFATVVEGMSGLAAVTGLTVRYAATILLILIVGLVFYLVPNTRVRLSEVWVGAILTGVLWRAALEGFSWYVSDPSRFNVHGSIAAVVVFLFWVHLEASIFLYGVEFTAAYARLRRALAAP